MAMTASNPPAWGDYTELTGCFRTFGTPSVISPDGNHLDVAVTAYSANNYTAVYAASTDGGTDFHGGRQFGPAGMLLRQPGRTVLLARQRLQQQCVLRFEYGLTPATPARCSRP